MGSQLVFTTTSGDYEKKREKGQATFILLPSKKEGGGRRLESFPIE